MQTLPRRVPLNGIRAFEAVARHGAVNRAAEELGVTPGAVSHQLRQLEQALGLRLFHRRNNALALSAQGAELQRTVGPALAQIGVVTRRLMRGADDIVLAVSATLAIRWLIPRLDRFRAEHPAIRVRLETMVGADSDGPDVDLTIGYSRSGALPRDVQAFMNDRCRLYAAPRLVERFAPAGPAELAGMPLIASTDDDWDWRLWSQVHGHDSATLSFAHRFDVDAAAIGAAQAGLGVVIAPEAFVEPEVAAGLLQALPGCSAMDFGTYWLAIAPEARPAVAAFADWLKRQVGAVATAARTPR